MNSDKIEDVENTNIDKETLTKLELLIKALDRFYPRKRDLMLRSFLHGLFVALGATVGLSILIAIVTYFISQTKLIPIIGDLIEKSKIERVIPAEYPRR